MAPLSGSYYRILFKFYFIFLFSNLLLCHDTKLRVLDLSLPHHSTTRKGNSGQRKITPQSRSTTFSHLTNPNIRIRSQKLIMILTLMDLPWRNIWEERMRTTKEILIYHQTGILMDFQFQANSFRNYITDIFREKWTRTFKNILRRFYTYAAYLKSPTVTTRNFRSLSNVEISLFIIFRVSLRF